MRLEKMATILAASEHASWLVAQRGTHAPDALLYPDPFSLGVHNVPPYGNLAVAWPFVHPEWKRLRIQECVGYVRAIDTDQSVTENARILLGVWSRTPGHDEAIAETTRRLLLDGPLPDTAPAPSAMDASVTLAARLTAMS